MNIILYQLKDISYRHNKYIPCIWNYISILADIDLHLVCICTCTRRWSKIDHWQSIFFQGQWSLLLPRQWWLNNEVFLKFFPSFFFFYLPGQFDLYHNGSMIFAWCQYYSNWPDRLIVYLNPIYAFGLSANSHHYRFVWIWIWFFFR